jgi:acetylornithine/N-succinyldiaminopimelate aminotransferase
MSVDNEIVLAVRGRGLMFAVDLVNKDIANDIYSELIERGFIVGNRGTAFRIDPPLIITESEFTEFVETLKTILVTKKGHIC